MFLMTKPGPEREVLDQLVEPVDLFLVTGSPEGDLHVRIFGKLFAPAYDDFEHGSISLIFFIVIHNGIFMG
jgi:hypothetical protein